MTFKQYRNKQTGEIVEGVFKPHFMWGFKWVLETKKEQHLFLTKRHFKHQYEPVL